MIQPPTPAGPAPGSWTESWDRFWFRPADPTPLGLIRICCGLIALYVHVIHGFHLQEWFGENAWLDLRAANEMRREIPTHAPQTGWDEPELLDVAGLDPKARARIWQYHDKWGMDPRLALARGQYVWSVWYHVTDPKWMSVVHGTYLGVLVLFTLGFYTRITSTLAWLGALSYIHRAPIALFGMDTILVVTLMYLMIGPSGAALSIDRLLVCYRARREALSRGQRAPPFLQPAPLVSANFALRLIQVHLCLIYLTSGLAKLQGAGWWNGTAVWKPLGAYEYAPLYLEFYADALRFLVDHRWLWEIVMSAGTWFTLFVEIGFPFLIWHWRWPMLLAALALHLGIGLLMGLMTFSFCLLTMMLAFVPAEAIEQLLVKVGLRGEGTGHDPG